MEDWIKAGKITAQAREYGKDLIVVGASHLEVTEKIEAEIKRLGGKLAFPVQISVNETAAHFNSMVGKDFIFKKGDLCKLDLGVSVNGAIGDTAISVDLGGNKALIEVVEKALEEALKVAKPGVKIREVGKVVEDTIVKEGFQPIRNLGGHGLDRYEIHSSPSLPNFDNGDENLLKEGQIIAIEPFASTGEGFVVNGGGSEIYELVNKKNVRNASARKLLKHIEETFSTLPFSKRDLLKKFDKMEVTFGLNALLKEEVLHEFNILVEKDKTCKVAQAEHTIVVGGQILTE